jgi:hypothetical protein
MDVLECSPWFILCVYCPLFLIKKPIKGKPSDAFNVQTSSDQRMFLAVESHDEADSNIPPADIS